MTSRICPKRVTLKLSELARIGLVLVCYLAFFGSAGLARGQNPVLPSASPGGLSKVPAAANTTPTSSADDLPVLVDQVPRNLDEIRLLEETLTAVADKVRSATVSVSGGSGIIVSEDGLILSCAHVGGEAGRRVRVTLADGRRVQAVTLGNNHKVDAGMMKITDAGPWPFVALSDEEIKPGRWCFAIGYPVTFEVGQEAPVRLGRVLRYTPTAITSDCTIMGGDSGGPLFDLQGQLIGINSRVSNSLNGNIAVPVAAFRTDWDQLAAGKDITHPAYLGVNRVDGVAEARVGSVVAESAAEQAGIKPGDVIKVFNRQPIANFDALREAVAQCQPGQRVRIMVVRDGEELFLRARLGELPRE